MKKLVLTLILILGLAAHAEEKPQFPVTPRDFEEYWGKYYVGISYHEGLQSDRPLILIFADPKDLFAIFRYAPLGELLFKDFEGKYNCTLVNMKYGIKGKMDQYLHKKDNPEFIFNQKLAEAFYVDTLPALFLVDPKERTYQAVPLEDCTREKLPEILNNYLEQTKPR